jgi:hypothetical protein
MIPLLGEEITLALIFQLLASENEVEKNKNKKIFFIIPLFANLFVLCLFFIINNSVSAKI